MESFPSVVVVEKTEKKAEEKKGENNKKNYISKFDKLGEKIMLIENDIKTFKEKLEEEEKCLIKLRKKLEAVVINRMEAEINVKETEKKLEIVVKHTDKLLLQKQLLGFAKTMKIQGVINIPASLCREALKKLEEEIKKEKEIENSLAILNKSLENPFYTLEKKIKMLKTQKEILRRLNKRFLKNEKERIVLLHLQSRSSPSDYTDYELAKTHRHLRKTKKGRRTETEKLILEDVKAEILKRFGEKNAQKVLDIRKMKGKKNSEMRKKLLSNLVVTLGYSIYSRNFDVITMWEKNHIPEKLCSILKTFPISLIYIIGEYLL